MQVTGHQELHPIGAAREEMLDASPPVAYSAERRFVPYDPHSRSGQVPARTAMRFVRGVVRNHDIPVGERGQRLFHQSRCRYTTVCSKRGHSSASTTSRSNCAS